MKGRQTSPANISLHAALTRKEIALAELRETELAEKRGKLVDVDEFHRRYAPIHIEIVRLIKVSSMSDPEKHSLLSKIAELHEPGNISIRDAGDPEDLTETDLDVKGDKRLRG